MTPRSESAPLVCARKFSPARVLILSLSTLVVALVSCDHRLLPGASRALALTARRRMSPTINHQEQSERAQAGRGPLESLEGARGARVLRGEWAQRQRDKAQRSRRASAWKRRLVLLVVVVAAVSCAPRRDSSGGHSKANDERRAARVPHVPTAKTSPARVNPACRRRRQITNAKAADGARQRRAPKVSELVC